MEQKDNFSFNPLRMKRIPLSLLLTIGFLHGVAQSYKRIHFRSVVADTHNDILMKAADKGIVFDQALGGQTQRPHPVEKGGLDVQVFSVYCDGGLKDPFAFANGKWIVWMP